MSEPVPDQPLKILLVQPSMNEPGGGTSVAAHAIDALLSIGEVTVLTWSPFDAHAIDRFYGTSITGSSSVLFEHLPRTVTGLIDQIPSRLHLFKRIALMRRAQKIAHRFDVVISTSNEFDAGVRCIQYVHFPWMLLPRPENDLRAVHRIPGILSLYYAAARWFGKVSEERMRTNVTLTNSRWTALRFVERYGQGRDPIVLYPAVRSPSQALSWSERSDTFVCVGRISPEKRIEHAVSIVDGLRERGHTHLRLEIAGPVDDAEYAERIHSLMRERPWIRLHSFDSHDELLQLLGSSRYGIHAMENEHFGIAVAEMMASGCVTLVHRSGGAQEIAGGDRLTWETPQEAVEVFDGILRSPSMQMEMHELALSRASRFSVETFANGLRETVRSFAIEEHARLADADADGSARVSPVHSND